MRYGAPGYDFDVSDVDAAIAREAHAERVCRALIDQRNRAYRRGLRDARDFDDEPTMEL